MVSLAYLPSRSWYTNPLPFWSTQPQQTTGRTQRPVLKIEVSFKLIKYYSIDDMVDELVTAKQMKCNQKVMELVAEIGEYAKALENVTNYTRKEMSKDTKEKVDSAYAIELRQT